MIDIPLILLVGPTAVGKTETSIYLAKRLNGEIISGDSMQVFQGFDIGTAKIKQDEMEGIPHHLIDVKQSSDSFSVAEFKQLVDDAIQAIHAKGKVPIIVGGTGLYIHSIIYDYHFGEAMQDDVYRQTLLKQVQEKGSNEWIYAQLQGIDPESAARIHYHDTKRIIRALEIHHITGKPASKMQQQVDRAHTRYPIGYMALNMDRGLLYEKINKRVEDMISSGWIIEVEQLLASGVPKSCLALQGLGYRHLVAYLEQKCSLEKTIELIKRDTRHFAKRQLTWFRNDPNVQWVNKDGKSQNQIEEEVIQKICRTIDICVE